MFNAIPSSYQACHPIQAMNMEPHFALSTCSLHHVLITWSEGSRWGRDNFLTPPVCPLTVATSAITYNLAKWREKEVIRAPKLSAIRIVKANPTQASILSITAK